MRIAVLTALILALGGPCGAEPAANPAVGLIRYGAGLAGAAVCTGTLVAPDVVLTARHCVTTRVTGQAMEPDTVTFAPGWPDALPGLVRAGREILPGEGSGWLADVALLVLEAPVTGVTPLPLVPVPPPGTALARVAYSRAEPDLARADDCTLLAADGAGLALSCEAVSGNSGAPVLYGPADRPGLVGVLVGRSQQAGPVRSLAVVPPSELLARIAAP